MLADFDTWKKYGNFVKRHERSLAALTENGTRLKHYFDISQTTAKIIPFQWSIDKDIAEEFLKDEARISRRSYRNMASYINNTAVSQINGIAEEILSKFDIEEKDKKAFLYSVATMVMTTVAARCEHKSTYKYKTPDVPDLTALHLLKTKEDVVKLCGTVHNSAHSILSKMERSITQIINIKKEERHNEQEQTGNEEANRGVEQEVSPQQGSIERAASRGREAGANMVRGGTGVVSPLHNGREGQRNDSVQAEHRAELHLQRSVLGGGDRGNGDRTVRQEMAGVYGSELPRHGTDNEYQQLRLGDSGAGGGQRSGGAVQPTGRTVSESEPAPHNVLGDSPVGKNAAYGDRPRGDGNGSASISGQPERDGINKNAAEASKEASAVFSTDSLTTGDVIKIIADKENPNGNFEKYGVVESISGNEIKIGLYSLDDTAFCSKSGVITHDIKTFARDYNYEYVGKANELRRDDYEENKEIYAAFVNHDIVYLTAASEPTEAYPVQNAHTVKFKNRRIEFNETDGEGLDKGFVLKGDTDNAKDLILASYGEISPESMLLWLKRDNCTVANIEKVKIEKSFSEQVDEVIQGKASRYKSGLKVCDTPEILMRVGCKQLPMLYTRNHLLKAIMPKDRDKHQHGLSVEQIKSVADKIHNPIMIIDSWTRNDSIIVVLEDFDVDKSPVIATVRPNEIGKYDIDIETNFITSIYGRDNFMNFINQALKTDNFLYFDKDKSQELFSVLGLKFPKGLNNLDFNIIIHQSRNIVNPKTQEISENQRATYITINAVRLGDFYELFGNEAKIAAEKLNLKLTSRNGEPMVGFPQHVLEQYKNQFQAAGYSLNLFEDLRQYNANKIISEKAEKYILPKHAFDEQVAITDEFFNYETAWHNVSKEIAEAAERYRKGEDVKEDLAKIFFKNDVNSFEWETVNNDAYKIQILTDDKGVDVCCDNAKRHFSWEDVANLHWNYLKNSFKEIQFERIAEYPEVKEDVDRLIANMEDNNKQPQKKQLGKEAVIRFNGDYWFISDKNDYDKILKPVDEASIDTNEDFLKSVSENNPDYANYINSHISELLRDIADINDMISKEALEAEREKLLMELGAGGGYGESLANMAAEKRLAYLDELLSNNEQTQDIDLKADVSKLHNFTITDPNLGTGGLKTKCAANIAAIKTLKQIEAENRNATPEEQEILSKYVGWGGMAQEVFKGNNEKWTKEHAELKELLTDEEYAAAKGSTLNAHYTTPTVINAIYKALDNMGFKKGKILEPAMGIGNFFGCMPEKMKDSELYGVELDSITGRIAKQLYPNADIQIKGFEKTDYPDGFFDVAIGNVPFGSYGVADRRYDKENFLIHDYFFAKTLDKVADGGIVAFITSKGTLDKANPKVREYIAKRADLLGTIRLPGGKDGAFKGNANDIV